MSYKKMTTEVSTTSEGQQQNLIKTNSSGKNYAAIRQKLTKTGLNLADAQQSSFNLSQNNNQTPSKNRKKNKFKVSFDRFFMYLA